jgi:hypothetical protein
MAMSNEEVAKQIGAAIEALDAKVQALGKKVGEVDDLVNGYVAGAPSRDFHELLRNAGPADLAEAKERIDRAIWSGMTRGQKAKYLAIQLGIPVAAGITVGVIGAKVAASRAASKAVSSVETTLDDVTLRVMDGGR